MATTVITLEVQATAVTGRASRIVVVSTGTIGPAGPAGAKGDKGDQGDPGVGLATGGTTGQVLVKSSATDYATTWQSLHEFPRPPIAGRFLPRLPLAMGNNGGTCSAYQELRVDFIGVSRPCSLGSVTVNVNSQAATAGTVMRIGIYAVASDGMPGSLLADLGTVDVTSTGSKTITFTSTPVSITGGGFWFARSWQGANSTYNLRAHSATTGGNPGHLYPPTVSALDPARLTNANTYSLFVSGVTGALPSNPTWSVGDGAAIPLAAWEVVSVP